MPSRIAWTFYDPVNNETYKMPVNPNAEQSSLSVKKTERYSVAAANYSVPGATPSSYSNVTIISEGPDEINKFSFSGIIYAELQYINLFSWANRNNAIEITDDIGRTFEVYVSSFATQRIRSANFPWKHSYTMEAVVKDVVV